MNKKDTYFYTYLAGILIGMILMEIFQYVHIPGLNIIAGVLVVVLFYIVYDRRMK